MGGKVEGKSFPELTQQIKARFHLSGFTVAIRMGPSMENWVVFPWGPGKTEEGPSDVEKNLDAQSLLPAFSPMVKLT